MVFSSMTFLFGFLPIVLLFYYAAPLKIKNLILMVSGIFFYAWGEPVYVVLMLFTTVVDYTAGRLMDKMDSNKKARLLCLLGSLIINLGLLCVFKYSSFIITNINNVFGTTIIDPKLPLPIGISFYTFQSLSYTIDLYMRKIKVQKNLVNYIAYVALFPQIVAGPIVRYADVANELESRQIGYSKVADGIGIFIRGLAKKLLLANNIGMVWTTVSATPFEQLPTMTAWIGILAFTFQIYYDFSGYSDMAIGMGKMLGFNFPINFDHPYMAKSISEFWRRWHITLGSWFKSYVYFPMGGNRGGTWKTLRNLLVVWFLTGLWHGASWNFVLWGLYFGALIILEKFFLGKWLKKLPNILQWMYAFLLVVFGWVFFELTSISQIGAYFKAMFGLNGAGFGNQQTIYLLLTNAIVFLVCIVGSTTFLRKTAKPVAGKVPKIYGYLKVIIEIVVFLVCICYLVNASYNPFLYFRF
ncbi:MBOAT family O-acyltransferase [Paludicola sp. MB14-C6]|uniref:MBOAT family O-acyltransferase n=1 Tax=Paludihabitans sp. MB14-C6 TaxID=3070656 RepID=UPI0027DC1A84|nr:MBOAT family O-acyltransferase [Paludicola sp. MB14-C6]WMJ21985.1 MBOAT family O-acyltransferase [Paludicola sp. MB14-C6]